MFFQLQEIEYALIDSLADGPEPLSLLIREQREGKYGWDADTVISALAGLMEKQLLFCVRIPGGVTFTNPTRETMLAQAGVFTGHTEQEFWFELTDNGQAVWEAWRKGRSV